MARCTQRLGRFITMRCRTFALPSTATFKNARNRPVHLANPSPSGREMANPEEELRNLATAIIEESGDEAHKWAKQRAALFRQEGDYPRAGFWEDVAAV